MQSQAPPRGPCSLTPSSRSRRTRRARAVAATRQHAAPSSPTASPAPGEMGEQTGADDEAGHQAHSEDQDSGLPLGGEWQRTVSADLGGGGDQLLVLGEPPEAIDEESAVGETVEEVVGQPGV